MWVRGLKPKGTLIYDGNFWSHPVWVRGLKRVYRKVKRESEGVAPRVGAWIETSSDDLKLSDDDVAPRVGAWIETTMAYLMTNFIMSHPVWVRGLKLKISDIQQYISRVAPRVGAWIETGKKRFAK